MAFSIKKSSRRQNVKCWVKALDELGNCLSSQSVFLMWAGHCCWIASATGWSISAVGEFDGDFVQLKGKWTLPWQDTLAEK
jgi:hypothetical protein